MIEQGELDFHGNHILNGGGYSAMLSGYLTPPIREIDLTNNYSGTTDSETVAEWIWDGNDDISLFGIVIYGPMSDVPMATEEKSWSDVKSLYWQRR